MNERDIRTLRLTGILGIVAALCWTIGDVLLLGSRAAVQDYPILATYAGSDFASQVVQSGVQFFGASPQRLMAGALIAVLTTPLYLASVWHIRLALRPAGNGPLMARPCCSRRDTPSHRSFTARSTTLPKW